MMTREESGVEATPTISPATSRYPPSTQLAIIRRKSWDKPSLVVIVLVAVLALVFDLAWPCTPVNAFFIVGSPWQQQQRQLQNNCISNVKCISDLALYLKSSSHRQRKSLLLAKAVKLSDDPWFPLPASVDSKNDDDYNERRNQIEVQAIQLSARLVSERLEQQTQKNNVNEKTRFGSRPRNPRVQALLENRFLDLACSEQGERSLEDLFTGSDGEVDEVESVYNADDNVLRAAIVAIQSLCILGTQLGVKGVPPNQQQSTPEQQQQSRRMVSHLDPRRNPSLIQRDLLEQWDSDSVRRLKYQRPLTAAVQLLAQLQWKRTAQGAFDLLVALGAWEPHEDIALLRSGFPLRFTKDEERTAFVAKRQSAATTENGGTTTNNEYPMVDPDSLLGIRKDLQHLKVFTIDGVSTSEIDDGLSVEKIDTEPAAQGGGCCYRIWIHIADADHYAPPGSALFETARKRITSLYLPRRSFSMFPPPVGNELMSLSANGPSYALSLGVEVNADGSINAASIEIAPSIIRVTYRLTYEEVDEMLEECVTSKFFLWKNKTVQFSPFLTSNISFSHQFCRLLMRVIKGYRLRRRVGTRGFVGHCHLSTPISNSQWIVGRAYSTPNTIQLCNNLS